MNQSAKKLQDRRQGFKLKVEKPKTRIVLIETVTFQVPGELPTYAETRCSRLIDTTEQPYGPRRLEAIDKWESLECGWVKKPLILHIANKNTTGSAIEVGIFFSPPKVTMDLWSGEIIVIAIVEPRDSCRFKPVDTSRLMVRSKGEPVKFTLTAFPE
jgi:hypothetical protein